MLRALATSATGMIAQQLTVDAIANNLANVNTPGYKRSRPEFQDLLYQSVGATGASGSAAARVPVGVQVGHGSRLTATQKYHSQGNTVETGNPLDMTVEGAGFFKVTLPSGEIGYTRDGSFKLDGNGSMVTSDGYPLEPAVTVPAEAQAIAIDAEGRITARIAGETDPQELAQIELARFVNPAGLEAMGRNLYRKTGASGDEILAAPGQDGTGTIASGYLEMSNVQVVEEMIALITAQRAYEINSKSIQTSDDMLSVVNQLKR
ncbi:MAG: flagellar basal-body rod protein FlgG [bacterium]